ncbi:twin-arginine translocase TatA/TatE family subunit [Pseudomonas sp. RC2C2]|nr:twin-arginine translocase TatA/TatE family subunit [Pseudomonas sp. RC2C2]
MAIMDWKHWIVVWVVVVLVFGTKKLKGLGADVGEAIKGFCNAMKDDEIKPPQPALSVVTSALGRQPVSVPTNSAADISLRTPAQ